MESKVSNFFFFGLTAIFFFAKIAGWIGWSWVWVFSPLIFLAFLFLLPITGFIVLTIVFTVIFFVEFVFNEITGR